MQQLFSGSVHLYLPWKTTDHLTGKAFPAWVYFVLQNSSSLGCQQLPKQ